MEVFKVSRGDLESEKRELLAGHRRAVIVFPRDFAARLQAREASDVRILHDESQPQLSQVAVGIIQQVLQGINLQMSGNPSLISAKPEAVALETGKHKEPRTIDFLIPGILAM